MLRNLSIQLPYTALTKHILIYILDSIFSVLLRFFFWLRKFEYEEIILFNGKHFLFIYLVTLVYPYTRFRKTNGKRKKTKQV